VGKRKFPVLKGGGALWYFSSTSVIINFGGLVCGFLFLLRFPQTLYDFWVILAGNQKIKYAKCPHLQYRCTFAFSCVFCQQKSVYAHPRPRWHPHLRYTHSLFYSRDHYQSTTCLPGFHCPRYYNRSYYA
jgi:hypothetical protein